MATFKREFSVYCPNTEQITEVVISMYGQEKDNVSIRILTNSKNDQHFDVEEGEKND